MLYPYCLLRGCVGLSIFTVTYIRVDIGRFAAGFHSRLSYMVEEHFFTIEHTARHGRPRIYGWKRGGFGLVFRAKHQATMRMNI